MKGFLLAPAAVLLISWSALAAQTVSPSPEQPAASPPVPSADAAYQFALAKLLSVEGSLPEALTAYEEAERLAPDSPYVRLEHGQLLARLAQYSRAPGVREEYLKHAAETLS